MSKNREDYTDAEVEAKAAEMGVTFSYISYASEIVDQRRWMARWVDEKGIIHGECGETKRKAFDALYDRVWDEHMEKLRMLLETMDKMQSDIKWHSLTGKING